MNISVENVSKTFDGTDRTVVMDGFSCEIAQHTFVCVVGPSGCGKTTLLNMLGGLETPDAGQIVFDGERTSSGTLTGIVWQDYALVPWRKVIDNVAFGLEIRGVGKRERRAEARRLLELMGIGRFAGHYIHQLSGGMRQRVGIARALASDPEILLMDEPFAAVDAQTRLVLQDELSALWLRERKTVLFITHSIDEALRLGDRVLVVSPRPMRILQDIIVPFDRPRGMDVERDPRFVDLRVEIWERLQSGAKLIAGGVTIEGEQA